MPPRYSLSQYLNDLTLPALRIVHDALSGTTTTNPAWPRTDLNELLPWTSFADLMRLRTIDFDAVECGNFRPPNPPRTVPPTSNEMTVQSHADSMLFGHLSELASYAQVKTGEMYAPAGALDLVGDPDRVWRSPNSLKPRLCVEFKTPWAFDVTDIIAAYTAEVKETPVGKPPKRVAKALSQLYGYMTFNDHRYGVLTTFDRTWFFERAGERSGRLRVAGPFAFNDDSKLLVGYLTLLRLVDERWFYASPTASPRPASKGSSAGTSPALQRRSQAPRSSTVSADSRYEMEDIGPNDIQFEKTIDRSNAIIARGSFRGGPPSLFKCVDASQHHDLASQMKNEVSIYRTLEPLHGSAVPTFHGCCCVWNMLHVLRMDHAGEPLKNVCDSVGDRGTIISLALAALAKVHALGVLHGDVRVENFLYDPASNSVRVIDFGLSKTGASAEELAGELLAVEGFFT
ncbi:hypothetical protein HKX48_005583 [Thoreauomyces humboldtii]|nr:hypothetical protein HKX48_005583 [Thoreauomyces humboldtii]